MKKGNMRPKKSVMTRAIPPNKPKKITKRKVSNSSVEEPIESPKIIPKARTLAPMVKSRNQLYFKRWKKV